MGWRLCTRGVVVGMLLGFVSAVASAQESTLRITQVYSNLDGTTQFIELTESAGLDGQHRVTGLTLTATGNNGVVKRYTFTRDLPTERTAHMSFIIATRTMTVLGASVPWDQTDYVGELPIHEPTIPERFVPIDGGTLEFASVDRITYASLPTDGRFSLFRDGRVTDVWVPSKTLCMFAPPCVAQYGIVPNDVHAVEYYHAGLDRYFISASATELDALDGQRQAGWRRTGELLLVGGGENDRALSKPVCRFYLPRGSGGSHFYSASADECEAVRARFPDFHLETSTSFFVALPDLVTGACGPSWLMPGENRIPVYRVWSARADISHRYTKQRKIRDQMIAGGYVSEGYGPDGVAWCVLPGNS